MEEILKKDQNEYCALMYLLLINGKFDNIISKMDDTNIITNTRSIVKKGYLISEEHFLEVMYHFINMIYTDFGWVKRKNSIIELIINHPQAYKILLSKRYIGNNNYINYYLFNIKKLCIYNFYEVLKLIENSDEIENLLKIYNIDINKVNLNKKSDVNKLYDLLVLVCLCNYSSYGLYYIFDHKFNKKNQIFTVTQIESLIEHTNKLKDKAIDFLNVIKF